MEGGGKTRVHVPGSILEGVVWPAVPKTADAIVLALQHQLDRSQWWPPETLRALQFRQLERLCVHAARTVPFYKDRLGKAGRPGGLSPETWDRVPVLKRAEVQEAGQDLLSRLIPKGHGKLGDITTSGSTGRPITVKATGVVSLFFQAINLRYHLWHGRDLSQKVAAIQVLKGQMLKAAEQGKPALWPPGFNTGKMYYCPIDKPLGEQLEWLSGLEPAYLLTYPSNLRALLQKAGESGMKVPGLREISTMGEVLDPDIREACQRLWGIPVIDVYSAQEVGMIALQCPDHTHYHVQAENVYVEVLDGDDKPVKPGRVGRLVVTDLHNFATPLIRYEIGDYAEAGGPCPCGRGLPVLKRIQGRTRNMATLPNGEQVWPRIGSSRLSRIAPVRQIRLVQRSLEEIQIDLVVARPLTGEEEEKIKEAIGKGFGHTFRLVFNYMDEIPRAASGKYEDFRSEI